MNIAVLLSERARAAPDRNAIVDLTGRAPRILTFGQLDRTASRAAAAFSEAGLHPGARILVLHPMNATLYVALAGMLRAGLVPVVCDPAAGRATIDRACTRVAPQAVFASIPGLLYAAALPSMASVRLRFVAGTIPGIINIASGRFASPIVPRDPSDPALITLTSGSTAAPKVVIRTHAILKAQFDAICATVPLEGIDVATMPIVLLANLASGTTSVVPGIDMRHPELVDPNRLANDIAYTGATSVVASPAMMERLARTGCAHKLGTLSRIVMGGAPVMPSLAAALRRLAPHADIMGVYGSTEAEPIACVSFSDVSPSDTRAMGAGAGLLAGLPVPHATVRIHDGEIIVAGEHVVPGYLDGIGDSETKIHRDGRVFHRTGDRGYFDADGRLWLTGRTQAVIRDEIGMIEPLRVECALSFEPEIARSALTPIGGRRGVAIELRRHCIPDVEALKHKLAWAQIDEICIVKRIPVDRRHNAKIDYRALRNLVGARS